MAVRHVLCMNEILSIRRSFQIPLAEKGNIDEEGVNELGYCSEAFLLKVSILCPVFDQKVSCIAFDFVSKYSRKPTELSELI